MCLEPSGKNIIIYKQSIHVFLRIIRILLMEVLRFTKLAQFIKWQCHKHESSPGTIFRFNMHQTAKSHQTPSQWKHWLYPIPDVINVSAASQAKAAFCRGSISWHDMAADVPKHLLFLKKVFLNFVKTTDVFHLTIEKLSAVEFTVCSCGQWPVMQLGKLTKK